MDLESFLKDYYRAAMRIAKTDEVFNECLVLNFTQFISDYDGVTGSPGGYILMRLRFAVLKYTYKENRFLTRYGSEMVQEPLNHGESQALPDITFDCLPDDLREVIDLWSLGLSQREISEELGVSIRKVRARINAAITVLKDHYEISTKSDE